MSMLLRVYLLVLSVALLPAASATDTDDIGLTTDGQRIDALRVEATTRSPLTVVLVGGLQGDESSAAAVRSVLASYEQRRSRPWRVLAVPLANPQALPLRFPPTGVAYRDNAESQVLWRWLGTLAPDLVLIAGTDAAGLADALASQPVADMGRIPAQGWLGTLADMQAKAAGLKPSEAHTQLQHRLARTPQQLAQTLAQHYGGET